MKILLTQEKVSYILDSLDLEPIGEDATKEERTIYKMWQSDSLTIKCIILALMSNELQRQHEDMEPQFILLNLKELYREQSRTTRYEISK